MSRSRKSLLCLSATVLIAVLIYLLGVVTNSSEANTKDPLVITQAGTYSSFSSSCWIHSLEVVKKKGSVKIIVTTKDAPGRSIASKLPFDETWKITVSCKENNVLCVSEIKKLLFDNSNPSRLTLREFRP